MVVSYDNKNSDLFYKHFIIVMTVACAENMPDCASSRVALALSRSVNYDHKVPCKFNCAFKVVNYDCIMFIVQAIVEINLIFKF